MRKPFRKNKIGNLRGKRPLTDSRLASIRAERKKRVEKLRDSELKLHKKEMLLQKLAASLTPMVESLGMGIEYIGGEIIIYPIWD